MYFRGCVHGCDCGVKEAKFIIHSYELCPSKSFCGIHGRELEVLDILFGFNKYKTLCIVMIVNSVSAY